MDHLESFIAECDRRTELAKKRLAETQEEISAEVSAKVWSSPLALVLKVCARALMFCCCSILEVTLNKDFMHLSHHLQMLLWLFL